MEALRQLVARREFDEAIVATSILIDEQRSSMSGTASTHHSALLELRDLLLSLSLPEERSSDQGLISPSATLRSERTRRILAILDAEQELDLQQDIDTELMETRRSIVSESSHETESVAGHGTARLVRADSDVWNPAVGAWSLHGQDYRTPSDSLQLSTGDTAAYGYVYENQRRMLGIFNSADFRAESLFPTDRPKWSDADGSPKVLLALPPGVQWQVAMERPGTDGEGWEYAFNFVGATWFVVSVQPARLLPTLVHSLIDGCPFVTCALRKDHPIRGLTWVRRRAWVPTPTDIDIDEPQNQAPPGAAAKELFGPVAASIESAESIVFEVVQARRLGCKFGATRKPLPKSLRAQLSLRGQHDVESQETPVQPFDEDPIFGGSCMAFPLSKSMKDTPLLPRKTNIVCSASDNPGRDHGLPVRIVVGLSVGEDITMVEFVAADGSVQRAGWSDAHDRRLEWDLIPGEFVVGIRGTYIRIARRKVQSEGRIRSVVLVTSHGRMLEAGSLVMGPDIWKYSLQVDRPGLAVVGLQATCGSCETIRSFDRLLVRNMCNITLSHQSHELAMADALRASAAHCCAFHCWNDRAMAMQVSCEAWLPAERALQALACRLGQAAAKPSGCGSVSIGCALPTRWWKDRERAGPTTLVVELIDPGTPDVKIGAVPATFVGRLHVDIPQLLWNSRGDDRTPAVGGDSWFTLFDGSGELRLAWMLIDTAPSTPIPSPSAWFAAVCAKAAAALQDESRSTAQHPLFLDGHGLVVKPELLPSWLVGQSHWLAVQEGSKFKMDSEGLLNRPKPDVDSSLDNCRGAVSEPVVTTEDRSALSKLLRHGGCIPEEFRHWLWPALASTPTSSAKLPLYPALIQQYKDADDQQQENVAIKDLKGQIALDIPRTFPFQRTCVNTTAGEEALERIVGSYALYNKRVGYSQSMNLIAGHLLCALGLHDEETCFWILRHFSEEIVPGYWAAPDLPGLIHHTAVLEKLLGFMLPRISAFLSDVPTVLVGVKWLSALFTVTLPLSTAHRLWDLLLVCGTADVLLSAALSCLRGLNPDVVAQSPQLALQHSCEGLYDAHPFLCSTIAFLESLEKGDADNNWVHCLSQNARLPNALMPPLPALLRGVNLDTLIHQARLDHLQPPITKAQLCRLIQPFSDAWERHLGTNGDEIQRAGEYGSILSMPSVNIDADDLSVVLLELLPGLMCAPFVLSRLVSFAIGPTADRISLDQFLFMAKGLRSGFGCSHHAALCFGFFDLHGDGTLDAIGMSAILETLIHSSAYHVNSRRMESVPDCVARICTDDKHIDDQTFAKILTIEQERGQHEHETSPLLPACRILTWGGLGGISI